MLQPGVFKAWRSYRSPKKLSTSSWLTPSPRPLPPTMRNLTASAAKAGVTGKRARFGWVMRQG